MIGVDIERLEMLIKKNDQYLESLKKNIDGMMDALENLSTSCNGSIYNTIINSTLSQADDINKIYSIINSYSETLNCVIFAYQKSDQDISKQLYYKNQS